jgi:hypothetical protein
MENKAANKDDGACDCLSSCVPAQIWGYAVNQRGAYQALALMSQLARAAWQSWYNTQVGGGEGH